MPATISSHSFVSYGYDGPVFELGWAALFQVGAGVNSYSVGGNSPSFRVTAGGTGDRAVTINALDQVAFGKGVYVRGNVNVNVNLVAPSSGTRYDLIALRRHWGTNTSSIVVIEGGGSPVLPTREVWTLSNEVDDQPLALVPVTFGQTNVGTIIDLRTWHYDGTVVAKHNLVLSFMDRVGTRIRVGAAEYLRNANDAGGSEWTIVGYYGQRRWTADRFSRPGPWDTYGNAVAGIVAVSLPASAPPGDYQATYTFTGQCDPPALGNRIRVTGPGGNYRDNVADYDGVVTTCFTGTVPFYHSGGGAVFLLSAFTSGSSRSARVYNYGTYLDVYYIGSGT